MSGVGLLGYLFIYLFDLYKTEARILFMFIKKQSSEIRLLLLILTQMAAEISTGLCAPKWAVQGKKCHNRLLSSIIIFIHSYFRFFVQAIFWFN